MEDFFLDSLGSRLGRIIRHPQPVDTCKCYESLQDVTARKNKIDDWSTSCGNTTEEHECMCYVGNVGPVFGEMVSRCRASDTTHHCICRTKVIPGKQMISELGSSGFVYGRRVCRALNHGCICDRLDPIVCRSTSEGHYCSCSYSTTSCRLNEDGQQCRQIWIHECRCSDDINVPCRRHPVAMKQVSSMSLWKHM